jgi:signal transduction histidine kinase
MIHASNNSEQGLAAVANSASEQSPVASGQQTDLEIVLAAWRSATDRLQKTHELLRDEVHRLSDELEIKNRELARQNRLADLGQMASHVAHEVRNGMAPITLYLGLLRRRMVSDHGSVEIMEKIDAGLTALEATVTDLLSFTSDRDPIWRNFNVRELTDEVCESLAPQLAAQKIVSTIDVSPTIFVTADRDMLRRAVVNLVFNAIDAMRDGGGLFITAVDGPQSVELEIADSGPGIDPQVCKRIFEPFFTTKSEGTGLGLPIVLRIAEAHGGGVTVANCPEGGAAFTIRLPRRSMEAAA